MKKITIKHATKLITNTVGAIFGVTFVKQDGLSRHMTARIGVSRHLKTKGTNLNPLKGTNVLVFDMDAEGYRTVKLDSIQTLTVSGKTFKVA